MYLIHVYVFERERHPANAKVKVSTSIFLFLCVECGSRLFQIPNVEGCKYPLSLGTIGYKENVSAYKLFYQHCAHFILVNFRSPE